MKKWILLVIILAFFICPAMAVAVESQVIVTIPKFPISINDEILDYRNDRYPFVLYKDITYFPMTYDHCSYLGVAVAWTEKDGLYVAATGGSSSSLPDYGRENNTAASYTARIASFPIHVNGRQIDNNQEMYPLLLFRDITYFPMNWRFATEELSWEIYWNEGLEIRQVNQGAFYFDSIGSDGADLKRVETIYREESNSEGSVTYYYDHDDIYYARLKFTDDSVVPLRSLQATSEKDQMGAASVDVQLQGNFLYCGGDVIADISNVVAMDADSQYGSDSGYPISVHGTKRDFDGGYFLEVSIYYENGIPAPYTPSRYLHFAVFDGIGPQMLDFGENERFQSLFQTSDGIYIATLWYVRYVASRESLWFIAKDGSVINVNDRFDDYENIRLLGVVDDTAYLKCSWQQQRWWASQESGASLSLINDGYYKMGRDYKLIKIYPLIAAREEMLTPDGTLYVVPGWRNGILNLTKGTFIDLSDIPISEVQRRE
jgi:hypothetical protein